MKESNKEIDIEKLTKGLENKRNIENKKRIKFNPKILIMILLLVVIGGFTNNYSKKQKELQKNPWAAECTKIESFEYKLENQYIHINKFIGKDKKIKVCKTYMIDDKEYYLNSFTDNVFISSDVYSVMLPNGLKEIPSKTFEDSDVKYIFIPKSLQANNSEYQFSHYLNDVEKIYYEGTQLEWQSLTEYEKQEEMNVEEIIYDAKTNNLN